MLDGMAGSIENPADKSNDALKAENKKGKDIEIIADKKTDKEKMFSGTFLLLWQGQFVSSLGDTIYALALGFWVLATTGSTALMGSLMAASVLPGVLVAPFAGVIVDRYNKKALLIMTDAVRAICVILIAVAAYNKLLSIWMVFAAGIVLSLGGAFYHPATNSVIPDIVPKSRLTNANSVFGMIFAGSNIIGNSLGGFLYQLAGAPLMFLFNGLSFLFSGASIFPAKIPKHKNMTSEQHFFDDMKDGFRFVWKFKGLRYMIAIAAVLNFFSSIAIILFLPFFEKTPELGATRYGIAIASFTVGMFLGMITTSIIRIPPAKKLLIFMTSALVSSLLFASSVLLIGNFILLCVIIMVGGLLNSIPNVFIMSCTQAAVRQEMRGKVFALINTMTQGLTPIAMAIGGLLGEFIPIPVVISVSFIVNFFLFIPLAFNVDFKRFINFDHEGQTIDDIL